MQSQERRTRSASSCSHRNPKRLSVSLCQPGVSDGLAAPTCRPPGSRNRLLLTATAPGRRFPLTVTALGRRPVTLTQFPTTHRPRWHPFTPATPQTAVGGSYGPSYQLYGQTRTVRHINCTDRLVRPVTSAVRSDSHSPSHQAAVRSDLYGSSHQLYGPTRRSRRSTGVA